MPGDAQTVSVVMPNYNHGRYIVAALHAHLSQRRPPDEIVVVDDGSTDDSRQRISRHFGADNRVRLIALPENRGPNHAINLGLSKARGDHVCLAAADDLVLPGFLDRSLAVLSRHPTAAFSFCDPAEMTEDGDVTVYPLYLAPESIFLSPEAVASLLCRNNFTFSTNTILVRRGALLEVGGLAPELDWLSDWFATHVMALRHGACYVPGALARFRISPHSYSARGVERISRQRALIEVVLRRLQTDRFRDVAERFRACALLPEYRLRTLRWMLSSPWLRRYLTLRLVGRIVLRGSWHYLRPAAPVSVRHGLRAISSRLARAG